MGTRKRYAGQRLVTLVCLCLTIASLGVAAAEPGLMTLNYKNADLRDVLNTLAAQAGVSITMDETVSGTVSFHFQDVTLEECLNRLAAMYRLYINRDGRFYTVTRQLIRVVKEAGDLISLECQTAKLHAVLAELTRVTGTNFTLIGAQPTDYVNIVLNKVRSEDLAAFLAESTRCQLEKHGGVYLFRTAGALHMSVGYENERLVVDLVAVPLGTLVREITIKTGISVICDPAAAASPVTILAGPLPLEEGLNAIAAANGLRVFREGEHYRFAKSDSPGMIRSSNGRLSIDVRNVEITEVLAEISRQSGVTILPDQGVSGRVSGTVADGEFERNLRVFLEANGFALEQDGAAYQVKRRSTGSVMLISINEDGTIDLDVTNASLATCLTELARRNGFGIVIYANVNWNVTSVHVAGVGFEEALERLMAGTTFTYRREGRTYLVGEGVNFRQGDTDFLQSELIPLKYISAESTWNTLPASFPRQNVILLKDSNALYVNGSAKMIAALKAYLAKFDVPQEAVRTEVVPLKHMKAEDALKLLPPSIPKTDLIVVKEVNSIAVTGNEGHRTQVRAYLEKIDVMAPMILFDVLVLQLSRSDSHEGGLSNLKIEKDGQTIIWGDPDLPGLVGTIVSPGSPAAMALTATLNAVISSGRGKVRANPKIATLSGNKAHFEVVTKYNYTMPVPSGKEGAVTYQNFSVDSGITLDLVPWVSADKEITLELKPRISQYATSEKVGGTAVTALPGVMERSSESVVRIKDGYTVVISGFIQESEELTESRVPILGSIPIIGHLFRSTTKKKRQDEFVIIITPRLIMDPAEINKYMAEVSGEGSTAAPIAVDMDDGKKKDGTP